MNILFLCFRQASYLTSNWFSSLKPPCDCWRYMQTFFDAKILWCVMMRIWINFQNIFFIKTSLYLYRALRDLFFTSCLKIRIINEGFLLLCASFQIKITFKASFQTLWRAATLATGFSSRWTPFSKCCSSVKVYAMTRQLVESQCLAAQWEGPILRYRYDSFWDIGEQNINASIEFFSMALFLCSSIEQVRFATAVEDDPKAPFSCIYRR